MSGSSQTANRSTAVGDLRQLAMLLEGLRVLSSARVLDDVLRLVMDSAISVGGAERGFSMLAADDGVLEFRMGRSRDRQTLPGSGFETSRMIREEVFMTGTPRIDGDLLDGDLANQHMGTTALGIRNVLCVPLRLLGDVQGWCAMDGDGEEFGDGRLLESIAGMSEPPVEPKLKRVFASVSAFTAAAAQNDGVTAMVVGYHQPQAEGPAVDAAD